ncbi:MAG TPA: alpha/beta fold hydrolase, partial [Gammaproteobacteria bacterium]|nr:alpha/beta fold hydrolase [Gammaproteobacteria bacterium]
PLALPWLSPGSTRPCGSGYSRDPSAFLERPGRRVEPRRADHPLQLRGDRQAARLLGELRAVLAARPDPQPAALAAGLDILATTDLRAALPGLRRPVLVVAGERDRLTPAEAGRRMAAGLPDARFLGLPGAAHAPFLSHPAAFLDAIGPFLRGREIAA